MSAAPIHLQIELQISIDVLLRKGCTVTGTWPTRVKNSGQGTDSTHSVGIISLRAQITKQTNGIQSKVCLCINKSNLKWETSGWSSSLQIMWQDRSCDFQSHPRIMYVSVQRFVICYGTVQEGEQCNHGEDPKLVPDLRDKIKQQMWGINNLVYAESLLPQKNVEFGDEKCGLKKKNKTQLIFAISNLNLYRCRQGASSGGLIWHK